MENPDTGALVALKDDAYGVSIHERLQRAGMRVSLSAIYTSLERLEQRRVVNSELGEPTTSRGGRRKRLFRITPTAEEHSRRPKRSATACQHYRRSRYEGPDAAAAIRERVLANVLPAHTRGRHRGRSVFVRNALLLAFAFPELLLLARAFRRKRRGRIGDS